MKLTKLILIGFCVSLLIVVQTNAAYIDLRIDGNSLSTDGEAYLPASSELTIDVWMVSEGEVNLNNYSLDLLYDATEGITYTGGEEFEPTGWLSFAPFESQPPYVQGIEGLDFTGVGISFDQDAYRVASLNFSVDPSLFVYDGLADFEVFYRPGQGMTIDDEVVQIISVGADLAAVPVPSAVWLLGTGLLGIMGLRRRNRS